MISTVLASCFFKEIMSKRCFPFASHFYTFTFKDSPLMNSPDLTILPATTADSALLTDITIRSKAFWGYSSEQIERWKKDLTITSRYIEQHTVFKLLLNRTCIAYYSFYAIDDTTIKLDNLFVDPTFIRQGHGSFLMKDLFQRAAQQGIELIQLDSEPFATAFYQVLGFKIIGQLPSSIKDRYLPVMECAVSDWKF